ncbi:Zn-dependent hydrolase [Jiangella mangrovi]|uniref:N-carbamoyl-L-amino-acid hydrolase n=1 Tax=Jiangella mangrovi TaxID=1524084 RepID=A0A7W9LKG3_9ACTN|nr:Zn-dependent hydrolase [Jiangella mangrovi]MBB5787034.1 N-carbamoyl-L-amino-acid hydrolase [Jiangella mangrovi]
MSDDDLTIDGARLRATLETLATFGAEPSGGVSRTSFSPADAAARAWLRDQCEASGLSQRTDGIGNIVVTVPAPDASEQAAVWTGSHIDSVPDGGRFDGALGSMAALEVVRRLAETRVPLRRPVEMVVFADEEGCYHHLLGSTALVRPYAADELERLRGRDGDRLVDALDALGWDVAAATRTTVPPGTVHAFVELHIEQGAVLESAGTDLGVVTSIVGMGGGALEFIGRADHAGTTPMRLRRDPLRGAGEFLAGLPAVTASISETAVATCGIIAVEPGGANVVPSLARLQLDFRDVRRSSIEALESALVDAARRAAAAHDLEVRYTRDSITDPAPLDPRIQDLIESVASAQGHSTRRMPSGAGHDSQNMSRIAPTGMIFIPSTGGRSHSPAEHSSWEDIERGANVLLRTIVALATE